MSVNDNIRNALESYGGFSINERVYNYLGSLGYTGTISDRLAKYSYEDKKGWQALIARYAGTGWTPAALFAQGQQGVWYEPKPEYLYQDAAGTIPVTADRDPVGYMQDLRGNGNHATQSMSARRPIYRTDGVLHWLEPDRVDDTMSTVGPVDLTGSPISTIFTAIRKTAGADREVIIGSNLDLSDSVAAASPERDTRGVSTICRAANVGEAATVVGFSSETDLITSHITDFATATAEERYTIRVNGIARSVGSVGNGAASLSQGNLPINLFSRPGSQYFGGRFYGAAVVSGEPPDDEMEGMESYLAKLAGVTL